MPTIRTNNVEPRSAPVRRAGQPRHAASLYGGMVAMAAAALAVAGLFMLPASRPSTAWVELDPLVKMARQASFLNQQNDATTAEQLRAVALAAPRTEKLADAEETVDENGIVHGALGNVNYTVRGRGQKGASADKVTLAAVGDQLATDNVLALADDLAGTTGDGLYDFNPWYEEVGPVIRESDVRFINQETVMIDSGEYPYSGYPSFNTPGAAAQAIASQGFNLVNFTTNHTFDFDTLGVERSHEVWARYPQLLVGGSFLSNADRQTVHVIERNGIAFAVLCYTYGDNRFDSINEFPDTFHSSPFDYAHVASDLIRARKVADSIIVVMHWGTEYISEPNSQQREWSQWLADQDVDLVIGTHAHTIQPVEYIQGKNGNKTLVVFGLSDFVSGWEVTDTIISGIFTCDMVRDKATGRVRPEHPAWHPTIEWSDGNEPHRVRLLAGMDRATTNANICTPDVDDDYTYVRTFTNGIITQIPVDWEGNN